MLSEKRVVERLKKEKILQSYQARETLNQVLSIHPEKRGPSDQQKMLSILVDYPCF